MPPRTDWQETIAPDEATRFEGYARYLGEQQKKQAAARADGSLDRALHAKAHVGARAELRVLPDLPEPFRVGIFAAPGNYSAWVRYSNGHGGRRRDHVGDVRGVAIKIVGVPGRKLIPGMEDARTQDFLLIQTPSFGFRNADEFIFFVRAMRSPATLLPRLFLRFGFGRTLKFLSGIKSGIGAPANDSLRHDASRFASNSIVRWTTR